MHELVAVGKGPIENRILDTEAIDTKVGHLISMSLYFHRFILVFDSNNDRYGYPEKWRLQVSRIVFKCSQGGINCMDGDERFSTLDMLSSLVAVIPLENILFIQKFKCICVNLKLNLASS